LSNSLIDGTVVENHGALFDVMVDGRVVRCMLRGKLKKGRQRSATPVAAGDRVKIGLLEPGRGVIEHILPRDSGFSRRAAGGRPLQQTLVANLDQTIIVFAAAEPRADLFMLDRFLVAATASELEHVICVNKCDRVDGGPLRARFAVYHQCGFRVLYTSAADGMGIGELRDVLKDRRSVLCGPSGVGKSSLLNALAPGLSLRTAEVGDVTHKGRHTTTSIQLIELPFGGSVADTAGLREFKFVEACGDTCPCDRPSVGDCPIQRGPNSVVEQEHVVAAFPDVAEFAGRCRFRDCRHRNEPGCSVRRAVATRQLDARRVKSFMQMAGA
jgi:ribosome biogenesis GTPase